MTIADVIANLQEEKQKAVASRFPCRAIMVDNVQQYNTLLSELKKISDIELVSSDILFSSVDVMPRYENLKDIQYRNRWLILPGVSEYLRLFGKSEAETQRFAKLWSYQASADSVGRIIIPLWGCKSQWYDKSLHLCDDLRQNDFFIDCSDFSSSTQKWDVVVLSGEFETYLEKLPELHGYFCNGLKEWYEYWCAPNAEKPRLVLLTKRFRNILPTTGDITVRIIQNALAFIKENLKDGHLLTESNCPEAAVKMLFNQMKNRSLSVDEAVLSALNIAYFSATDIMSKWTTVSVGYRQLVALWFSLHPDNSYLCHCIQSSENLDEVARHILFDIFELRYAHPEWVQESQMLIEIMHLRKNEDFFAKLDDIPIYEERLGYLSGFSKEERIYLLHMVGKWMREDAQQLLSCETLSKIYPELQAYLCTDHEALDAELRRYFSLYKAHKLENTLPIDEEVYFSSIQTEKYAYRYAAINGALTSETAVLWIDALGAEWLPLLIHSMQKLDHAIIHAASIAQATLPTETRFNDQWNQMEVPYQKLDKLDKLAHKGVVDDPDYYACVEEQIAFVSRLYEKVSEMLKTYQRVIITGDHGTSRLAARFFHKKDGYPVSKNTSVFSHGRYCQTTDSLTFPNLRFFKDQEGKHYYAFDNYDHFVQSGFAAGNNDDQATYGEIHGGATPEEILVPVVVIDSTKVIPLIAEWQKNPVKIMIKKAKTSLEFSRNVHTVQAKIGAIEASCMPADDQKHWSVIFTGVTAGTYPVAVTADGNAVGVIPLTIRAALGDGDGDLP